MVAKVRCSNSQSPSDSKNLERHPSPHYHEEVTFCLKGQDSGPSTSKSRFSDPFLMNVSPKGFQEDITR